ncbi:MAG: UvrD-helicase domain-containing protein [Patescibacteria group bacterium]|nr:UvrD-helicase domain-containing protein [Patescibacteria group bacterium]
MSQILQKLNPEQRKAAQHIEGPLLIIAGAGSGKTNTITHRIAYLIQEVGIPMENILAVTFTNKAAKEMRERVESIIGHIPKAGFVPTIDEAPLITTFHSFCLRLLRAEGSALGYRDGFQLYDGADQKQLIKQIIKEWNWKEDKMLDIKSILGQISRCKNHMIAPESFFSLYEDNEHNAKIKQIYGEYQKRLVAHNAMDFDDLLLNAVRLFKNYPDILEKYQERFQYITVDEYQDTNAVQYELMKMLAEKYENICVVGDDDQSIYGWRGADIKNILDFEKDYSYAEVIKLEQNYRSTQVILDASNAVIQRNTQRKSKKLWSDIKSGRMIQLQQCWDERDEGNKIAEAIEDIRDEHKNKYKDFAVLYRTNAQSRALEEAFLRHSIPYRIIGGTKFYDRKEIKDMMAYLRLILNPEDAVALQRIINVPARKIGATAVQKIIDLAGEKQSTLFAAAQDMSQMSKPISAFVQLIETFIEKARKQKASETIEELISLTGYKKLLLEDDKKGDGEDRYQNLMELLSVAQKYDQVPVEMSLSTFLEEVALVSELDTLAEDQDSVTFMTLHSSKGLEFPCVFLSGVEQGLFPGEGKESEPKELEEERRLMYVGMTRAKRRLHISYTTRRMIYGMTKTTGESMFVSEIPAKLTVRDESTSSSKPSYGASYS